MQPPSGSAIQDSLIVRNFGTFVLDCLEADFANKYSVCSMIRDLASFIHSFIHVQSVENVGTRKKRKENMRKAIDVETKKRKH